MAALVLAFVADRLAHRLLDWLAALRAPLWKWFRYTSQLGLGLTRALERVSKIHSKAVVLSEVEESRGCVVS